MITISDDLGMMEHVWNSNPLLWHLEVPSFLVKTVDGHVQQPWLEDDDYQELSSHRREDLDCTKLVVVVGNLMCQLDQATGCPNI